MEHELEDRFSAYFFAFNGLPISRKEIENCLCYVGLSV
jgi:hypothetical protein